MPIILVHVLNARRCEILQKQSSGNILNTFDLLNARRCEILQKQSSGNILNTFDYHQPEDCKLCAGAIEKLCCKLQLNAHCAFLDVLIPSVAR